MPHQWRGPTIRAALVLGFGAVVVLWLFEGLQNAGRMTAAQQELARVNDQYARAQDLLSVVRAEVLLASVFVRDALLDPDPARTLSYLEQVEEACQSAEDALARYEPVLDTAVERTRIAALEDEIRDFRSTAMELLASDRDLSSLEVQGLLNFFIAPSRDSVVSVSEEVQSLNRHGFLQQQAMAAGLTARTQRRAWTGLGLALAASFCIALAATVYGGGLERDLRRRREAEVQATRELQRLSERLVTAQEEERRAIARDLHDDVGQALMAIKMELAMAQRAVNHDGRHSRGLEEAQSLTAGALSVVRNLSHALHPAVLDDLGLVAATEQYLRGIGTQHELRVSFTQEGLDDERPAAEVELAAFRIAQEAVTNVARHARARRCVLRLSRAGDELLLSVEDDGVGVDAEQGDGPKGHGLGLVGMRERAAALGGSVRVENAPDGGTRVQMRLPWRVRPAATESIDPPRPLAFVLEEVRAAAAARR